MNKSGYILSAAAFLMVPAHFRATAQAPMTGVSNPDAAPVQNTPPPAQHYRELGVFAPVVRPKAPVAAAPEATATPAPASSPVAAPAVAKAVEPAPAPVVAKAAEPAPAPAPTPAVAKEVAPTPAPEPVVAKVVTPEPTPAPAPAPVVAAEVAPEPVVAKEVSPTPAPEPVVAKEVVREPAPEPVVAKEVVPEPTPEPVVAEEVAPTPAPEPVVAKEVPAPAQLIPRETPAPKTEEAQVIPHAPLRPITHDATDKSLIVTDDVNSGIVAEVHTAPDELPEGTLLRVRLDQEISTNITERGAKFQAVLNAPVERNGKILIPAGAVLNGRVTGLKSGRHIGHNAAIHLQPDFIKLADGTTYKLDAQVIDLFMVDHHTHVSAEGTILGNDNTPGTIAALGATTGAAAATGAVFGGAVGAFVGAGIGAGASTMIWLRQESTQTLAPGTIIVFSLNHTMILDTH